MSESRTAPPEAEEGVEGRRDPASAGVATSERQPDSESAAIELVPRFAAQGYEEDEVARRREWVARKTGAELDHVGRSSIPSRSLRGNIENPIGSVQMPLGVAGPLRIRGEGIDESVYVPMATTEGALVRSYERGMVMLSRAGGVTTCVERDENRVAPTLLFDGVEASSAFAEAIGGAREHVAAAAESTTSHGRLTSLQPYVVGRRVILEFRYHTADAQGMNMIVRATEEACRWIADEFLPERRVLLERLRREFEARLGRAFGECRMSIFSGYAAEKRAAASLLQGGKGKRVQAAVEVPRRLLRQTLRVTPEDMVELWRSTVVGHLHSGSVGFNGHAANGLTSLFIACGQDVANVANAAVAISVLETTRAGDLFASVTLPSLTVATVGGGTALATSRECLQMIGCWRPETGGNGLSRRFAQIAAAMVLAGDLSFSAAIISGEFVAAHERYGRNRPDQGTG